MDIKEIIGKQLAENCDSIASSRMILELFGEFDQYEVEEDALKRFIENLILIYRMKEDLEFASDLKKIYDKMIEIDAEQDAIEANVVRLTRNIKNENWLSNGLWRTRKVNGNEKKKEHLEKVG